jgi:hypothetical protein
VGLPEAAFLVKLSVDALASPFVDGISWKCDPNAQ